MNDVELTYDAETPAKDLEILLELRLIAARIPAEVHADKEHARIVVDAQWAEAVDRYVTWRGGLTIERIDPPSTLIELRGVVATADGRTLLVLGQSATDAARLRELLDESGSEVVVFKRGRVVLLRAPLKDVVSVKKDNFIQAIIPRGERITAYHTARTDARILTGMPLPPMKAGERRALPPDHLLAAASLFFPLLAGALWIVFIRRFDRAHPEPLRLVVVTCAFGALTGPLAGKIESLLAESTPWLDPSTMELGRTAASFPISLFVYTLTVGIVEEGCKLLAVWVFAWRRREIDEPIDGMIFAAAAGIGFALEENLSYFTTFRLSDSIVATRSLSCIAVHMLWSSFIGYAIGKRLVAKKTRILPFFALSAVLHAGMDTSLAYGVPYAAFAFTLASVAIFVVLVRRALRWGSVTDLPDAPPASTQRTHFAVGHRRILVPCIVSMFALAAALEGVAFRADLDHVRLSLGVIAMESFLVISFGLAAWAATYVMPLDAVIDEVGVTFGGGFRKWADITGLTRKSVQWLVIQSSSKNGDLRIGPGSKTAIDALEAALIPRLTESDRG